MHRIEAYMKLAIIFIVVISIFYTPILIKLKKKGISPIRQLSYIGIFCSVFLIVFATILFVIPITFHPASYILNLNLFGWIQNSDSIQQFIVEKIPNIALFMPLGFFLPAVFTKQRKIYKTMLVSFIITFSIEFFQYFIGRSSDIVDIITNLLGALIGYGIYVFFNKLFNEKNLWNKFIGD